ncbi:MAG: carboxypeptidase-like regulatory domain-containing protein [Pricia sp.]|nr:carboxypeptidase-like regulatory domain-containing protein [Pricia sp.]
MRNTFLLVALVSTFTLFSQNEGSIKGNIVDLEMNNEPVLFADVKLQDTDWKTQTNFNGNFELLGIEPGAYTLEVSFLGYETIRMPVEVKANSMIQIEKGLQAKLISLNDVYDAEDTAFVEPSLSFTSIEKKTP